MTIRRHAYLSVLLGLCLSFSLLVADQAHLHNTERKARVVFALPANTGLVSLPANTGHYCEAKRKAEDEALEEPKAMP